MKKDSQLNPVFILNEEHINQLYEEFNKKNWKNITLTLAKEIELNYEIIEPYYPIDSNNNISDIKVEKLSELQLKAKNKIYKDFGETTPLNLLYDKFYVYAVSRNIKYSLQSPQSYVSYINKNNNLPFNKNMSFDINKMKMNHFSLRIERIDKLDSYKSSELNETVDKK